MSEPYARAASGLVAGRLRRCAEREEREHVAGLLVAPRKRGGPRLLGLARLEEGRRLREALRGLGPLRDGSCSGRRERRRGRRGSGRFRGRRRRIADPWRPARRLQDDELDAAVLAPAALVVLNADRLGLAVAVAPELARKHVAFLERPPDRPGAPLGQIQVVGVVAALVGVSLDLDLLDPRVAVDRRRDRVDDRERLGLDDVLVGLEVDLVRIQDAAFGDGHEALVGASVLVVEAVVGLGLVGAFVGVVGDAVVVAVAGRSRSGRRALALLLPRSGVARARIPREGLADGRPAREGACRQVAPPEHIDARRPDRQDVGQRAAIDVEARVVLLGLEDEQGRVVGEHAVLHRQVHDLPAQRRLEIGVARRQRGALVLEALDARAHPGPLEQRARHLRGRQRSAAACACPTARPRRAVAPAGRRRRAPDPPAGRRRGGRATPSSRP